MNRSANDRLQRVLLYAVLGFLALVFLLPIYVMVVNSIKPLEEIRGGNLISLPLNATIEPWLQAACNRPACVRIS